MRPITPEFVATRVCAIAPQYRFCPKDTFPAQVHDVKAAVRWIKSNAKKYQVDPDRIGAIGFSAGGHLALMLGLTGPSDGLEGDVSAGCAGQPGQGRRQLLRADRPGRQGHSGDLQALGQGFPRRVPAGEARSRGQGVADDLRLQGQRARADVSGHQGPARSFHPGDQAGRSDELGGRARPGRAHGRRPARLGRRELDGPSTRRSVSSIAISRKAAAPDRTLRSVERSLRPESVKCLPDETHWARRPEVRTGGCAAFVQRFPDRPGTSSPAGRRRWSSRGRDMTAAMRCGRARGDGRGRGHGVAAGQNAEPHRGMHVGRQAVPERAEEHVEIQIA